MINIKVVDDATANLITVESVTVVWIPFASRINKYNHSTNILYNVLIIAMVYKTHFDVMLYYSMDLEIHTVIEIYIAWKGIAIAFTVHINCKAFFNKWCVLCNLSMHTMKHRYNY